MVLWAIMMMYEPQKVNIVYNASFFLPSIRGFHSSCSVGISPVPGYVKLSSPLKSISLVYWQLGCFNGFFLVRGAPNAGTKLPSLNGPTLPA